MSPESAAAAAPPFPAPQGTRTWSQARELTFACSCLATAAVNFFGGTNLEKDRAVLAVFPLFLLFFLLAWMTMLS